MLIQLTTSHVNPIQTLYLEYVHDLPEYPQTHTNGYTYVVSAPDRSNLTVNRTINSVSPY